MFYSAQTGGFYHPEIHGARTTMVQDPAWIRPAIDVVLQPGESIQVDDQIIINTDDEPKTLRNVFDMSAVPGVIEVANPDCLIPGDAVEITDERHAEMLAGQSSGLKISSDENGYPVLIDPPPPSAAEQTVSERTWRDAQLAPTDAIVSRHRDEVEEGIATTLTAEQYTELQVYRRLLRDWPQGSEFPLADHRPVAPSWLNQPLQ